MREVQPAILVRESNMQLLKCSPDTCVTYILNFKFHKGPEFSRDYLINYLINYTIGLMIDYTIIT